ncbi:hypothetical protein [Wolbachia phage WO]|uniref:Uncharacterized protein n=1 Tax=Wolbachia endosymbiont of Sergentomyia squamirostris TaxID=3113640 RepID=A0AAT9GDI7_9RICK|nr:hypothetical protein [Wolbachia phage WO]BDG76488.1 hypothetical protein wHmt_10460 [Wolbachia pipientis]BDG76606.1 hypothetical protein wHmt_11640 [Wolbachia pipientis]BDG77956.1 hypothetical protein wHmc_10880 [Wolbachia pipientis]GKS79722.1 hypothetical protein wHmb_06080 [Wolbachia pipientis]
MLEFVTINLVIAGQPNPCVQANNINVNSNKVRLLYDKVIPMVNNPVAILHSPNINNGLFLESMIIPLTNFDTP